MVSWSKRAVRDPGSGSSDFSLPHFLNSISGRSKTTGRLKDSETKVCINKFKILINIIDTVISRIYIYSCNFEDQLLLLLHNNNNNNILYIIIIVEPKNS